LTVGTAAFFGLSRDAAAVLFDTAFMLIRIAKNVYEQPRNTAKTPATMSPAFSGFTKKSGARK